LHAANVSGVCRDHMHGAACRCAWCRRPRRAGKRVKLPRVRIKTRDAMVAEGLLPDLLPGMDGVFSVEKGA
jgi:hypothetical protein